MTHQQNVIAAKAAADPEFGKMNEWLDVLVNEMTLLRLWQNVFKAIQEIIRRNESLHVPSVFYEFLPNSYSTLICMGIRRIADKGKRQGISLPRLLERIATRPELLSRSYFAELYEPHQRRWADHDFNEAAGEGRDHLTADEIQQDVKVIEAARNRVEAFVDKRLAHHDEDPPSIVPTFADLDAALDEIEVILKKYYLLFRAGEYMFQPVIQYDWLAPFRHQWLRD